MKVEQIALITKNAVKQTFGETVIVNEDLSNLVDIGNSVFGERQVENYTKSMVDCIGKMIFVARKYEGASPSIFMDNWEFGSIVEKVRANIQDTKENKSWDLTDGETYPSHVFYQPTIQVSFFNDMTTFDVPVSFTDNQLKSAFHSIEEMNSFLSMIYAAVENTLTINAQSLAMRCINLMMAIKVKNNKGVIHLLTEYNAIAGTKLTQAKALTDKEFLKYVASQLNLYSKRLSVMSKNFTLCDYPTFTPLDEQKIVLLENLASALDVYVQSDTYHENYTKIGTHDTVPFWQGSGTSNYALADISKIDVTHSELGKDAVTQSYIVGVLFDKYACGISLFNRRTTSEYTASAEFTTNYNKEDARYFVDSNENIVVFVLD